MDDNFNEPPWDEEMEEPDFDHDLDYHCDEDDEESEKNEKNYDYYNDQWRICP